MDQKYKDILMWAVLIVEYRGGDVSTVDEDKATTDVDTIINLGQALCAAFETTSDDATMLEIGPKINAL